jgi:GntR family transcriptional regulator
VCELLRTELSSGVYADDVVPSEDRLMQKYGVSRGVIRRVLAALTDQGVIERVRGAGTFALTSGSLRHRLDASRDLIQEVNVRGARIAIREAHATLRAATPLIAQRLEMPDDEEVVIIDTVTSLDGFPLSVRTAFMPAAQFGVLATDPQADLDRSPYDLIAEVVPEPVGDTDLEIGSSTADPFVAEVLRVPVGFPLLDTTRVIRTVSGVPVEFSISHARADRLTFSTVMRSTRAPG